MMREGLERIDDPAWMVRGELPPGEVRYLAAFAP